MKKPKFVFPKYRKLQKIRTPDGHGAISSVNQTHLGFMYEVDGKFYHEDEVKPL
jgi:hypothetical protein